MKRVKNIINRIVESNARIIGIDGAPFSGKSTLAGTLTVQIRAESFSFDKGYIPTNPKGRYPDYVDAKKLKSDVESALERGAKVVIEGPCLRSILKKVNIHPDLIIYVRNKNNATDFINQDITEREYLQLESDINNILKHVPDSDGECLEKDNARYHMEFLPVSKADIVYERLEHET